MGNDIKNVVYVVANVMNMNAKFSFMMPLMFSEEKIFEYFFRKFTLYVGMATKQS